MDPPALFFLVALLFAIFVELRASKNEMRLDKSDETHDIAGGEIAECAPNEVKKEERCYSRKKPGEFCNFTEQCSDAGSAQYYCIANICQMPPECPPGHASVGAECFPFAVTGGECLHPIQCLSGSVCIKGACRGPCDENQIFIDDNCVDYEGGGCVARACVRHKCPRAYPSCNYVPQKDEYLCCERQIRSSAQCADSSSIPQISPVTNEAVNCMYEPCGPGFSCQFSNHGGGSYICCSIPTQNGRNVQVLRGGRQKTKSRRGKMMKKINNL